jgi:hypothetical protein
MVGDLGQVSRQRRQFSARAGGQGRVQTLVKLGRGQPPVPRRDTEHLGHLVPVRIRGPEPGLGASTGRTCRREIIVRHGYILKDRPGTRNLGGQRLRRITQDCPV